MAKAFANAVELELAAARKKHPARHHSTHESYAVLAEEVDEFWDHVRAQKPGKLLMLRELIKIGAMAQRVAEDLELISDSPNV